MIMADVLTWFLLIVGILIVYNCYWLATKALFPDLVNRCQTAYASPIKLTGIGLAVGGPLIALGIAVAATKHPAIRITGFSLLTLAVFAGLAGSAGLAQRIGAGLRSTADEAQPWRKVLRGGPVLALTCLLPFLGWFFLQGWILISGIGALVVSLTPSLRKQPAATEQPSTALPDANSAAQ